MIQLEAFPDTLVATDDGDTDERYTLPETVALCSKIAGVDSWHLDVAACAAAHVAPTYYTKADNGLLLPWNRANVWANPPWSNLSPWVEKAWDEWEGRRIHVIGMLLPSGRGDVAWWQDLVEPHRDRPGSPLKTRFLAGRTRYAKPDDLTAANQGPPPFGSVFIWWSGPYRRRAAVPLFAQV